MTILYLEVRMLAYRPVVYYYFGLCLHYVIKDPLCSRMYIRESLWNAFYKRVF